MKDIEIKPGEIGQPPYEVVKYPKIPYVESCPDIFGHEGYVFEKIDGSLSQIRRTELGIFGGSKANYLSGTSKRPPWAQRFLKWMHSNNRLYNLRPNLVMYGEWLEPVTVEYPSDRLNKFYFIDLASIKNGKPEFFDYLEAVGYLRDWGVEGIEIFPPLEEGLFTEAHINDILLNTPSQLGIDKMEGVVLKNYRIGKFAKFLHPDYSEIRGQEKTLEAKYLTLVRVNKAKRRLRDKGVLDFSLDDLVREVVFDINEETKISFSSDAVRGVIRARNYFNYEEQKHH